MSVQDNLCLFIRAKHCSIVSPCALWLENIIKDVGCANNCVWGNGLLLFLSSCTSLSFLSHPPSIPLSLCPHCLFLNHALLSHKVLFY